MVIVINSEKAQANILDLSKDEYIALLLTLTDRVNSMSAILEASDNELRKIIKASDSFDLENFKKQCKKQLDLVTPIFDKVKAKRKELEHE